MKTKNTYLLTTALIMLFAQNTYIATSNEIEKNESFRPSFMIEFEKHQKENLEKQKALEEFNAKEGNKYIAILTTGFLSGGLAYRLKASLFGIVYSANETSQLLSILNLSVNDDLRNDTATKYPHAHAWYKELSEKYPRAHFQNYSFRAHPNDPTNNLQEAGWAVHPKRIYATKFCFDKIDSIYAKKIKGEELSTEEQTTLETAEFYALHEAGHLNNNDNTTGKPLMSAGLAAAIETTYQIYKKHNPTVIQRSLPKRLLIGYGAYLGLSYIHTGLNNTYSRYVEDRADNFAIENANLEVLKAGKQGFEKIVTLENQSTITRYLPLILCTHPTIESRIEKIEAEITRRELDKIK